MELGRHLEASAQLELVASNADTPPSIAALGRALRERIAREAGRLTIALPDGAADANVTLDGAPIPPAWRDREIPVAPGAHRVVATRGGTSVAEAEVVVRAGDSARVRLALGAGSSTSIPLHEDWRFWLGVGGGAVALIGLVAIIAALAGAGGGSPVQGNFTPGVLTW